MKVALWAEKSMEGNVMQPELSLADAIAIARDLDCANLFDQPPDVTDFPTTNRIGAVAGAAAMALKFGEPKEEFLDWGREVIYRAVSTPLDAGPMTFVHSQVMFHPVVFSACALTALVECQVATDDERRAVLELICHPLQKVMEAIYRGLAGCWKQDPLLCWQAFALGMRLAVEPWEVLDKRQGDIDLARPEEEARWVLGVLDEIETDRQAGRHSTLPSVPPYWVPDDSSDGAPRHRRLRDDPPYQRSELAFLWDIAQVVLISEPLAALLATSTRRDSVLQLTSDLLDWTIMDNCPPFERQYGGKAYDWSHAFLDWCAGLSEHLSVAETDAILLDPIRGVANKPDAGHLLEHLMYGFIKHRFSQNQAPNEPTILIWSLLCDMLFAKARSRGECRSGDWLANGYGECVPLAVFCYAGHCFFDHPWLAIDAVRPTLQTWVKRFSESKRGYSQLLLFLSHAGRGLSPDLILGWIHHVIEIRGQDARFWRTSDNGSRTAALLEQVLGDHEAELARRSDLIERIIVITDVLTSVGVRQAARIQQRLDCRSCR